MKEIGFVGLGAMGSAMAPLLSKADFNVYGYDIKKFLKHEVCHSGFQRLN